MNDPDKELSLLRDLNDLASIKPDAEATARAMQRARAGIFAAANQPSFFRRNMMSLRYVGVVAAAVLVMVFVTQGLRPTGTLGGLAFGEVQSQVAKTRSVQYTQTHTSHDKNNHAAPVEVRQVSILGKHQKREHVKITTAGDALPDGQRWTTSPGEYVMIYDAKTGKTITLYPDKQGYTIPRSLLSIDPDTGKVDESKIEAAPEADFYRDLRDIPTEKTKKLADRTIGGKLATGFQVVEKVERPAGADTWTRTYWVDPQTRLPVRIEVRFESTHPLMQGASEWVQTDFVFDAELDQATFSTQPPQGYKDLAAETANPKVQNE